MAPIPLTCGVKKRAATLENTTNADKPWKFGMLARTAYPGIFELAHSIGKGDRRVAKHAEIVGAVSVLPDVLGVHHQVPSEGLLQADVELIAPARSQRRRVTGTRGCDMSALITGSLHPRLESTRFSLNGVSRVRA